MPDVQVGDQTVSFPDSMSAQQISQAIRSNASLRKLSGYKEPATPKAASTTPKPATPAPAPTLTQRAFAEWQKNPAAWEKAVRETKDRFLVSRRLLGGGRLPTMPGGTKGANAPADVAKELLTLEPQERENHPRLKQLSLVTQVAILQRVAELDDEAHRQMRAAMKGKRGIEDFATLGGPNVAKTVRGMKEGPLKQVAEAGQEVSSLPNVVLATAGIPKGTFGRAVSAGFATQMAFDAARAVKQGKPVKAAVTGAMGVLAGAHALGGEAEPITRPEPTARPELTRRQAQQERELQRPALTRKQEAKARTRSRQEEQSQEQSAKPKVEVRDRRSGQAALKAPMDVLTGKERRASHRPEGLLIGGETRATQKGEVSQGGVGEHPGVPQGANVPENKGEVRQGEGGQTGGSSRAKPKAQVQSKTPVETIAAAAYRTPDGKWHTGPDHPSILQRVGVTGFQARESRETPDFGFQTSSGKFVTREDAAKIAKASGQQTGKFDIGKSGKEIAHADTIRMAGQSPFTIQGQQAPPPEPAKPATPAAGEPSGDRATGVSQRVREKMGAQGRAAEYVPGVGWSSAEAKAVGRQMKSEGVEAEPLLEAAEQRRSPYGTGETMARLAVHDDDLVMAADQARDAYKANPTPENQAAMNRAVDTERQFYTRYRALSTELARGFVALQGEVDVDTGAFSPTRLERRFEDVNHRPMNVQERKQFEAQSSIIKDLENNLKATSKRLDDAIAQHQQEVEAKAKRLEQRRTKAATLPTEPEKLRTALQDRIQKGTFWEGPPPRRGRESGAVRVSRGQVAPDVARAIWGHAKRAHIDPAARASTPLSFDDAVNATAKDLGLDPDTVRDALAGRKSQARQITNEMYRQMAARRDALTAAKIWAQEANERQPGLLGIKWGQWYRNIINFPRGIRVFGHGTVGMQTHAGPGLFTPSSWGPYWRNTLNQWKYMLSEGTHERALQDLVRDPDYPFWLKNGLAINPTKFYDNYQVYGKYIGKVGRQGNYGMDALKTFRLEYAKQEWAKLSEGAKADPEMGKMLARAINHISGYSEKSLGGPGGSGVFFAPSLEVARWQRYGDVIKSFGTAANWNKATPAQKAMAKWTGARVMEIGATFIGTLAANNALLAATGQKQRVNFSDPTKSDFMKFKWAGRTADPTGGAAQPARLVGTLLAYGSGLADTPIVRGRHVDKREALQDAVNFYLQGKFNPLVEVGYELGSQQSFTGRPLPFSSQPGTAYKPKYTWPEYAIEEGPIPFAGAGREFYDSLRERGVDDSTARAIIRSLIVLGIESQGTRIGDEPRLGSTAGRRPASAMSGVTTKGVQTGGFMKGLMKGIGR